MSKNKKTTKEDIQIKTVKKISRDAYLTMDTLTKVVKDKTVYDRKKKHKKPLV